MKTYQYVIGFFAMMGLMSLSFVATPKWYMLGAAAIVIISSITLYHFDQKKNA